jgi:hypothetical protein
LIGGLRFVYFCVVIFQGFFYMVYIVVFLLALLSLCRSFPMCPNQSESVRTEWHSTRTALAAQGERLETAFRQLLCVATAHRSLTADKAAVDARAHALSSQLAAAGAESMSLRADLAATRDALQRRGEALAAAESAGQRTRGELEAARAEMGDLHAEV